MKRTLRFGFDMRRSRTRSFSAASLVLFCALLSPYAAAETAPKVTRIDPPKQILFVGNSFIYYNAIPRTPSCPHFRGRFLQ